MRLFDPRSPCHSYSSIFDHASGGRHGAHRGRGIQHETNTFAPTKAGLDAFETGGSHPLLITGLNLFPRIKGKNLPVARFVEQIEALDYYAHGPLPRRRTW